MHQYHNTNTDTSISTDTRVEYLLGLIRANTTTPILNTNTSNRYNFLVQRSTHQESIDDANRQLIIESIDILHPHALPSITSYCWYTGISIYILYSLTCKFVIKCLCFQIHSFFFRQFLFYYNYTQTVRMLFKQRPPWSNKYSQVRRSESLEAQVSLGFIIK